MKFRWTALLAALLLAGCGAYALVSPSRQVVQNGISVEPGLQWNKVNQRTPEVVFYSTTGPVEAWTMDGEKLDAIVFFVGIRDGAPLITQDNKKSFGTFYSNMTPNEIMDLVQATLSSTANTAVTKTHDLRPAKLGDTDGFRFAITYTLHDDIDRELTAIGALRNGKLYLILYEGTAAYHYAKYLPEFERIVQSVSFVG